MNNDDENSNFISGYALSICCILIIYIKTQHIIENNEVILTNIHFLFNNNGVSSYY